MAKTLQYLNMTARVTVGKVRFDHITSVSITETVTELGNKATIELPRNFKKLDGKPVLDYIAAGDAVTVELGYDGKRYVEFTGYVAVIDAEMPLVLHCEDAFYLLKQNSLIKAYKSITLRALLEEIMPGYTIECPEVTLGKFQIDKASTYGVLKKIQSDYALFSRLTEAGSEKKITLGYPFDWTPAEGRWILDRQKNVKSSNLTWKRKSDWKTTVKVRYYDGKKIKTYTVGDPSGSCSGGEKEIAANQAEAKKKAESIYGKMVYNGFTGSLTSFGLPRIHAGDAIDYRNALELEKNGVYLVDKVTTKWGPDGYTRESNLAHRLDKID